MTPDFNNTEVAFKYRSTNRLKQARFLFGFMASRALTSIGIAFINFSMSLKLPVNWLLRNTIFRIFCGGETLQEMSAVAEHIAKYKVSTILDYGVEGKETETDFDNARNECIQAIRFAAKHKNMPFVSLKITGYSRFSLLEKIHSSGVEALDSNEKDEWNRVVNRINMICGAAAECKVMVLIDAEETWIQTPCNIITELMMQRYNKGRVFVFNTYQLYCHGTLPYLKQCIQDAVRDGYLLGVKIVRGAYMEKERLRAAHMNYPDPIQPNKESTDRDFNEAILHCMRNLNAIGFFIGTHNEKSNALAVSYMSETGLKNDENKVWFSQLFGMSDNISFNLGASGYNVAKYMPYGPVKDVIPYLLRRATENTSVGGQTSRELVLIDKELRRRKA